MPRNHDAVKMLIRQHRLLLAIQNEWANTKELAAMLGIKPRTLRRDIDALCEAGFPIVEESKSLGRGRGSLLTRYKLMENAKVPWRMW